MPILDNKTFFTSSLWEKIITLLQKLHLHQMILILISNIQNQLLNPPSSDPVQTWKLQLLYNWYRYSSAPFLLPSIKQLPPKPSLSIPPGGMAFWSGSGGQEYTLIISMRMWSAGKKRGFSGIWTFSYRNTNKK